MGVPTRRSIRQALKDSPPGVKRAIRGLVIPPFRTFIRYAPLATGKAELWSILSPHLCWLESYVVAETVFGSTLYVDAKDTVGRFIYYFGVWEPNLTSWISERLKPGDTFIDVGANVGYFSVLASKLVGGTGKVVAIEAVPQIFCILSRNVKSNGILNTRSINVAVWNEEKKFQFFTQKYNTPGSSTAFKEWATRWDLESQLEVQAAPLTAILRREEMETARLIKIDVEGAEWHVISGMESMLRSSRADLEVVVEVTPKMLEAEGTTCENLVNFFGSFGFYPYRLDNDYSARAYISRSVPSRPTRIETIPRDVDQIDIVFSRVNTGSL
jgi:FkbM family methyltransferase